MSRSLSLLIFLVACDKAADAAPEAAPAAPAADAGAMPAGHPSVETAAAAPAAGGIAGTVEETLDAGSYTYVRVKGPEGDVWAAVPPAKLEKGQAVTVPTHMPMKDFHSKTLNRDFPLIYFADSLTGEASAPAAAPTAVAETPAASAPDFGLDPAATKAADGSPTVAGVWADRAAMSGKTVSVKGRVVKFTAGVMGKNWLHLQDGTGAAGTNDLTVTTLGTAEVGADVVVTGKVSVDQDFGYGYKYAVLVSEAEVKPG